LIPNPGTLISINAWKNLGGYDTRYRWAGDLDFWIRLQKIGKIQFLDIPMSMFRWHDESLTAGQRIHSLSEASTVRLAHCHKLLVPFKRIWEVFLTKGGEYLRSRKMGPSKVK
jgi:hypothetical protein